MTQILIDLVCVFVCLFGCGENPGFFLDGTCVGHARDISRSFETGSKKRSGASGVLRRKEPKVGSRKFAALFQKKFDHKTKGLMTSRVSKTRLCRGVIVALD